MKWQNNMSAYDFFLLQIADCEGGSLVNPYGQPDHSISRFIKPSLPTWPRLPKNANAISSTFVFESSEPSYLLNSDLHSVGGNSRCVLRLSPPHCTHPHTFAEWWKQYTHVCICALKTKPFFKVIFLFIPWTKTTELYKCTKRAAFSLNTQLGRTKQVPLTVNINSHVGTGFFYVQ